MVFDPARYSFDGRMREYDRVITELVRRPSLSGVSAPYLTPDALPVPKAPTGLAVVSNQPYLLADGTTFMARVIVEWTPVTENVNNAPIAVTQYEVWAERDGGPRTRIAAVLSAEELARLDFPSGSNVRLFVRAGTIRNLWSAFSAHIDVETELDTEPMDAPTAPTLSSRLGSIVVDWDGELVTGPPPAKFRNMIAEVSATNADPWVQAGPPFSSGGTAITGQAVGDELWVRLRARDSLGIESPPSASASIVVAGVGAGEIEVGTITFDDLDDAITDAIADAATGTIDPTRLIASSISTSKLLVASLANLLEDPGMETNSEVSWNNATADVTKSTSTPRSGSYVLRMVSTSSGYEATRHQTAIAVQPGEQYLFLAWARMEGAGAGVQDGLELAVAYGATAGATSTVESIAESPELGSTYVRIDGTWTVPAGVFFVRPAIVIADDTPGSVYLVDDLAFIRRNSSELIVDGAITAGKLAAGSVTAEAIAAGSITANAIQAGAITAEKLAADSVTANAIAADSVTANAIQAGVIEAYHLTAAVGESLDISSNESINLIVGDLATTNLGLDEVTGTVEQMGTYYQFGENEATITTGVGSVYQLALSSTGIEIREGGVAVSTWDSGQMLVPSAVVDRIVLGNHQIEKYADGTVVRAL